MASESAATDAVRRGELAKLRDLCSNGGGSVLNSVDSLGERSALLVAVKYGREHIVRWLLSDDGGRAVGFTNILGKGLFGFNALHSAAYRGHLECCKAIVEGCKAENGEREEMLNALSNRRETALHVAAVNRCCSIVQWLLSDEEGGGRSLGFKSESVTALNNYLESALHDAVFSGSVECIEALLVGCTAGERIKLFLAVEKHGWTILHLAAKNHKADSICKLLRWEEAGVMVNVRDHRGMTALHRLACKGGLDEKSRYEWHGYYHNSSPIEGAVRELLGLPLQAATTTRAAAAAFVDVNAGLEIPEHIKAAAAEKKRAAKKRATSQEEKNGAKRS